MHLAGPAARVHTEKSAVGEARGVRVDAVGQAALLPYLLEEAGAHAAAEGGVEHTQRPAAVVGAGEARYAEDDVSLLGPAVQHLDPARGTQGAGAFARCDQDGVRAGQGARALEGLADLSYDRGVVDVAGGGDDQVGGVVVLLVEAGDLAAVQRVDRVDGAEDRTAEGRVAEHRVREQVVHAVTRVVLGHRDLFEDDAALGVDVLGGDQRAGQHVADDVDGQWQVGVEDPRVVAGVLLRREGVHLAADRVDRGRDVEGAALGRALEQEVFEVVRRAVQAGRLVA